MADLLDWLGRTDAHPLIKSCVFHYEFEFIHPFADGNGRLGRLWQTLILTQWNPLFADIPVESMIYARQSEYYDAIAKSSKDGQCTDFVVFMLNTILEEITECSIDTPQVAPQDTPQVKKLLGVFVGEMTRREILDSLELSDRKSMTERYLRPALAAGLIEMTIPDKPNSRNQKYRITAMGKFFMEIQRTSND